MMQLSTSFVFVAERSGLRLGEEALAPDAGPKRHLVNDLCRPGDDDLVPRNSDAPCFICSTRENTVDVKLKDKSFSGTLCFEHVNARLKAEEDHAHRQERS